MTRIRMLGVVSVVALLVASAGVSADDWPQWRGPRRDGVWRETGLVGSFPPGQLKLRWSSPIGPGYSGPTVAGERVYVTDRQKTPKQIERVLCFDWKTGKRLWAHSYDCRYRVGYPLGPRASVTVDDGRAYALGTMGHFHCLDAATGAVIWKRDLNTEYRIRMPMWGIAASPLVDGDRVVLQIGGADGACVVALDKTTGEEKWRALKDRASYSSPILIEQAGRRVLVCWTADSVAGLDPATGKVYWQHPFKPAGWRMNVHTPIVDGGRLFVTSFFDGSLLLRLAKDEVKVEQIWRRRGESERNTDSLHSTIGTAHMSGEYIYGIGSYGQLRCLKAANGDRVWEDKTITRQARWSTIHMVRNGERMWIFNELGELILAELSPTGCKQISRAKLIEPTSPPGRRKDKVCWMHPAFAYRHVFARNDRELVCASLAPKGG